MKEKVNNVNKDAKVIFLPEGQVIPTTAKQGKRFNDNIMADGEGNQEISKAFIKYYKRRKKTSNMEISIK